MDEAAEPPTRVQLDASKEPEKDVENVTVPKGAVGLVALVSVTVAVHLEACFTTTGVSHETEMVVARRTMEGPNVQVSLRKLAPLTTVCPPKSSTYSSAASYVIEAEARGEGETAGRS